VCIFPQTNNFVVQQRRSECLALILQWRGATLQDGEVEKVDLGAQDEVTLQTLIFQLYHTPSSFFIYRS
jgi:hypothetical protein